MAKKTFKDVIASKVLPSNAQLDDYYILVDNKNEPKESSTYPAPATFFRGPQGPKGDPRGFVQYNGTGEPPNSFGMPGDVVLYYDTDGKAYTVQKKLDDTYDFTQKKLAFDGAGSNTQTPVDVPFTAVISVDAITENKHRITVTADCRLHDILNTLDGGFGIIEIDNPDLFNVAINVEKLITDNFHLSKKDTIFWRNVDGQIYCELRNNDTINGNYQVHLIAVEANTHSILTLNNALLLDTQNLDLWHHRGGWQHTYWQRINYAPNYVSFKKVIKLPKGVEKLSFSINTTVSIHLWLIFLDSKGKYLTEATGWFSYNSVDRINVPDGTAFCTLLFDAHQNDMPLDWILGIPTFYMYECEAGSVPVKILQNRLEWLPTSPTLTDVINALKFI